MKAAKKHSARRQYAYSKGNKFLMINKSAALKILKQQESDALKSEVLRLFRQRHHVLLLSVDQLTDCLPTGGACYWTLKDNPEDYWYVPVPGPSVRTLHTEGKTSYYAISKKTGEVSGVTLYGE